MVFNRPMKNTPRSHKEPDASLIRALGGPAQLARLLGLPGHNGTRRVYNWIVRGIPASVKVQRPDLFLAHLAPLAAKAHPPLLRQATQAKRGKAARRA